MTARIEATATDTQADTGQFRLSKMLAGILGASLVLGSLPAKCEARQAQEEKRTPIATEAKPQHVLSPDGTGTSEDELLLVAVCGPNTVSFSLLTVSPQEKLVAKQIAPGKKVFEHLYPTLVFDRFTDVVEKFFVDCSHVLHRFEKKPKVAVFAVAGVVSQNRCRYTNLDWTVDGKEIKDKFDIEVVEIVNDFVAQGYGTLTLADDEVERLNHVEPEEGGIIACVGAGNGLGTCFLAVGRTGHYKAWPSEMGHAEFAPRGKGSNEVQTLLLQHLKIRLSGWNRISTERVVSRYGICNIYDFLAFSFPDRVDDKVHSKFMANPTDCSIITANAWPGSLCEQALQIFAACYGGYCGNVAISLQPFGGLYLTGKITQNLKEWMLKDGSFLEAFRDKVRVAPLLDHVPLLLVKRTDTAQRGAHLRAVILLQQWLRGIAPRQPGKHGCATLVPPRSIDTDILSKDIAKIIDEFQRRRAGHRSEN